MVSRVVEDGQIMETFRLNYNRAGSLRAHGRLTPEEYRQD